MKPQWRRSPGQLGAKLSWHYVIKVCGDRDKEGAPGFPANIKLFVEHTVIVSDEVLSNAVFTLSCT